MIHVCIYVYSVGINDSNVREVRWCIQTTDLEKKARKAASQLFDRLNPLKLELSADDFLKKVQHLACTNDERKLLEKAGQYLWQHHHN